MALFTLSPVETRILGCLLEKERITPENYPLSLNSLIAACNQSTNRDPITAHDARTVEAGLDGLRQKKLAVMIMSAGSRVAKFRHELLNHFELSPREVALLCVLLLRGPQTLGELRSRTERMQFFDSLEQVETFLADLARGESPLVRVLPARPGQKERRYVQLLSGEPIVPETRPRKRTIRLPLRRDQPWTVRDCKLSKNRWRNSRRSCVTSGRSFFPFESNLNRAGRIH